MIKQFAGKVTPPKDMMGAARQSLSEQAFKDLMEQTGGRAPTADELCKMVDACRQAIVEAKNDPYVAALKATLPAMSSDFIGHTN